MLLIRHATDVTVRVKNPNSNPVRTEARRPAAMSASTRTSEIRTVPRTPAINALTIPHRQPSDSFLLTNGAARSEAARKISATPKNIHNTN